MTDFEIVFDPLPGDGLSRYIVDQLDAHNLAATGASTFYPVGFFLKSARGEWLGGLLGSLWGGWLHVRILWVDAAVRGRGYGKRLLEAAEGYAVERGCFAATLETHSFQARPFYEKCGYDVFGTLEDWPPGHQKFFLRKRLARTGLAVSSSSPLPDRALALLDFWFGPHDDPKRLHHRQIWFRSTPEFDEAVRQGFAADHQLAAADQLQNWEENPESALALVLLLDQVPRNIFRSTPRAFVSDAQALATTRRALANCFDLAVPAAWRAFFYLPFEHSEAVADQQRGLALLDAIPAVEGRPGDRRMSRLHLEIIERFGRFPHRNAILGRESTSEELAFLDECELRFGQPYNRATAD